MIQFDAPLQGIQAAAAKANAAASRIASLAAPSEAPGDQVDLSAEILALLAAKYATGANVKVAQALDELSQNVLNIVG